MISFFIIFPSVQEMAGKTGSFRVKNAVFTKKATLFP